MSNETDSTAAPDDLAYRLAGAPISWGVCEVPGWGRMLPPERVFAEMAELGLRATELGPIGYLPLEPEAIRDEKVKVLRALHPFGTAEVVRGQYVTCEVEGKTLPGYRDEEGVGEDSTTETFAAIRATFLEHQVIVIRGQSAMSPDDQLAFARLWGEVSIHPYVPSIEGYPGIMKIYDPNPLTETWHADTTHAKAPPALTLLLARTLPPVGGDTMFASAYSAFESLSPGLQQTLLGLRAVHHGTELAASAGLHAGWLSGGLAAGQRRALGDRLATAAGLRAAGCRQVLDVEAMDSHGRRRQPDRLSSDGRERGGVRRGGRGSRARGVPAGAA